MELSEINVERKKLKQFEDKGIFSVEDLVRLIPRKYYDFRKPVKLTMLENEMMGAVTGAIEKIYEHPSCLTAVIKDDNSYARLHVTWFNQQYLAKKLKELYNERVIVCGKITYDNEYQQYKMLNPMIFSSEIEPNLRIYPTYSKIKGMSTEYFLQKMEAGLSVVDKNENYSKEILEHFNIVTKRDMLYGLHKPDSVEAITNANKRLIFDDLYYFANELKKNNTGVISSPFVVKTISRTRMFIESLPYEATKDQKSTVNEIVLKMKKGIRVNALVQGDVGCGKTLIAFCTMLALSENGYQSVLMAPTNVLAKQHYLELSKQAEPLGLKVAFLSTELKTKEKKLILQGIKDGVYNIVIGTHSVIGKNVEFNSLGLTVVDEEHKFGVLQREALKEKAVEGVHSITMSATPIPRSLAISLYGNEIDVYTIKTLPNGRKPVKTSVYGDDETIYALMKEEIKKGHQCYVVCPLIEDSESEKLEGIESVETVYEQAKIRFSSMPEVKIGVINGKMKQEEVSEEISKFSRNEYQVIISTTIIEVGVNVPNATMIVIRNAERFGLSGLHQLRGRVGRGKDQAYCILKSADKGNPRLKAMCETTNGFEIAEKDLKLRGTGDFLGTKQSGSNKYVMLMLAYPNLYKKIVEFLKAKE